MSDGILGLRSVTESKRVDDYIPESHSKPSGGMDEETSILGYNWHRYSNPCKVSLVSAAGGHPVVKAQRVSEAIAGVAVKPVLYLSSGQQRELSRLRLMALYRHYLLDI